MVLMLPVCGQETAEEWFYEGLALYNQSKYDEAIRAYDEAIRLNPEDAGAWNYKGNALRGLGRYNEAIQAYDEAIRLDPKYTEIDGRVIQRTADSNRYFTLEMKKCLEKGECQIQLPNAVISSWMFESTENQRFSYQIDPSSNVFVSGVRISIKYAANPIYNPTSLEWPMNIWVVQVPGNYSYTEEKLEVCEIVLRSIWDTLYKDDFEGRDYVLWGGLKRENITTCWSDVCTSDHPAITGRINRKHGRELLDSGYGEGLSEATAYFIDPNYVVVGEYITRGKILQSSWLRGIIVQPLRN